MNVSAKQAPDRFVRVKFTPNCNDPITQIVLPDNSAVFKPDSGSYANGMKLGKSYDQTLRGHLFDASPECHSGHYQCPHGKGCHARDRFGHEAGQ